jgi:hypothetical protein
MFLAGRLRQPKQLLKQIFTFLFNFNILKLFSDNWFIALSYVCPYICITRQGNTFTIEAKFIIWWMWSSGLGRWT